MAELRQGEVITGLEQAVRVTLVGEVEVKQHPFALIASQDCDLASDYRDRQTGKLSAMNGVLIFEAFPADVFLAALPNAGRIERKQIKQFQNSRYHFLDAGPVHLDLVQEGIGPLVIDFRRYFTIPSVEIDTQLGQGAKRRCRLKAPFADHLLSRAFQYMGRIALPETPD